MRHAFIVDSSDTAMSTMSKQIGSITGAAKFRDVPSVILQKDIVQSIIRGGGREATRFISPG